MISFRRALSLQNPRLRVYCSVALLVCLFYWLYSAHSLKEPADPLSLNSMDFIRNEIGGDPLNFRWLHAVNSKYLLENSLKDEVHGIEADVRLRHEGTPDQSQVPIMAHPPTLNSDLTLDEFLTSTLSHGKSIIKLDFKSTLALELSLQTLNSKRNSINVPIWLNADILRGPDAPETEPMIPAYHFLEKVKSGFSDCTLSLGWTTAKPSKSDKGYSWSHVDAMYQTVKTHVKQGQGLTFAVNAAQLRGSVVPLRWLCEQFDASLTLFQSLPEDPVSISELIYIRSKFPKSRVFYDLKSDTLDSFKADADNTDLLTEVQKMTDKYGYKSENWALKITDNEHSELRFSSDVVWLRGPDALLSSTAHVSSSRHLTIRGVVTFLPVNENEPYKSNFQVYLFGKDHLNFHPTGIRVSINSNGRMIIASDHIQSEQVYTDAELSASHDQCYQLEIKVVDFEVRFTARIPASDCHTLQVSPDSSNIIQEKTIMHQLSKDGLVSPYNVILRNGKSDGYAILEQIDMLVTPPTLAV